MMRIFIFISIFFLSTTLLAQENYRLIKSDYFVENPLFQNYVQKNNLEQKSTKEGDLTRTTTYNTNGSIFQEIYTSDFKKNVLKDNVWGTYSTSGFSGKIISPLSTKPSIVALGSGDTYIGYLEVGTYYTKDGLIFTGFMLPTLKEFGNGSVLFMEDPKNKKCAWALIVDGNIDWAIDANINEKPDVEKLHQDFTLQFKIIADLPAQKLHLKEKKNPVANAFMSELAMINIEPKNDTDFNGYGLIMRSQSKEAVADQVQVFVGLFKHNVLNGMGYYATINNTFRPVTYQGKRNIQITEQSVHAMFGYFKQNMILQGRTLNVKNQNKNIDFWSATKYPGILYSSYEKTRKSLTSIAHNFSALPKNKITIYLPSVDREFDAYVDQQNGILKIRSDFDKKGDKYVLQILDGKEELIYYKSSEIYSIKSSCPKETKTPIYETKNERHIAYHEYKFDRRVTNGVYYNTEYNTTTKTPVYKTVQKSYFTGRYEVKPCVYCNGTGIVHHPATRIIYKPIDFDKPQSTLLLYADLHKQNLYSKSNYMATNTQMVYKDFSKNKPEDIAFTVQIIDELTRNRFGENEEAKTQAYANVVDDLVFFEEPQAAEMFLRYFASVRRTLILQILSTESENYFKNFKW